MTQTHPPIGPSTVVVMGWVVVLGIIGFLWVGRSEPSQGQASNPSGQPQTVAAPEVSTDPRILKFTLSLSEPDDLKVRQGDAVATGDVLADRSRERGQLMVQREKVKLSLQRIQAQRVLDPPPPLPVPPVAQLPGVSYRVEAAAIAEIEDDIDLQKRKIDLLGTLPPDQVPPAMREHEDRLLEQLYRDLEAAQANLKQAQEQRAYQEYEHSLAMARRAEEENQQRLAYTEQLQRVEQQKRDREFQIAQLEAQLQDTESKLADLSTVRSPYGGTIRRVKWLGQSDNRLTVEITLAVSGNSPAASPASVESASPSPR